MARKIEVQVVGDADSLHRALGQAQGSTSKFGSVLGGSFRVAALGAGAAVVGLGYALKRGIDDFNESQKVTAQTGAVLKSTGHAANVTAKQVSNLAQEISNYSGIDDEAVQAGENMLLTFKNIRNEAGKGNDIFDQSTKILADLSTAMGTDMKTSAIQLGKALNDPVKGITALTRVGVTFSDKQKELIQHLVDTGKAADAQKVILAELRSEFGGSAKAAGDTLAGQLDKLKNAFDNAASSVIAGLLPYVVKVANFAFPLLVKAMQQVVGDIKKAIHWVGQFASKFQILGGHSQSASSRIRNAFQQVKDFFRSNVFPIIHQLQGIFRQAMANIGKVVQQHGSEIRRIMDRVGSALKAIAHVAIPLLRVALVKVLPKAIGSAIHALDDITNAISHVASWFQTATNWVHRFGDAINKLPGLPFDVNKGLASQISIPGIDVNKGLIHQPIFGGHAVVAGDRSRPLQANLYLDGRLVYQSMVNQDKIAKRQTGRSLLA